MKKSAAIVLAALLSQIEWGDHFPLLETDEEFRLSEALLRFFLCKSTRKGILMKDRPSSAALFASTTSNTLVHTSHSGSNNSSHNHGQNSSNIVQTRSLEAMRRGEELRFVEELSNRWGMLRGYSAEQCIDVYLSQVLKWAWAGYYDFFPATILHPTTAHYSDVDCLFAVGADGLGLLHRRVGLSMISGCSH